MKETDGWVKIKKYTDGGKKWPRPTKKLLGKKRLLKFKRRGEDGENILLFRMARVEMEY